MKNPSRKFVFVASFAAAGCVVTGALVACGDDATARAGATPDGGGEGDASGSNVADSDAGTDAGRKFVPVAAATLEEFMKAQADAICSMLSDCCAPKGINVPKCRVQMTNGGAGWDRSLENLDVDGVPDGGKITYDPKAGGECLTAIRNLTCTTPAAEYKSTSEKCYAAVKGIVESGGTCASDVECAPTLYCDANTNECTPLKATNDECGSSDECSYRGAGDLQCIDSDGDQTYNCQARLANGKACNFNQDCESGACPIPLSTDGAIALTCKDAVDLMPLCDAL